MAAELILGANGYLGQYLARNRRGRECVLASRTPASRICRETELPFIQEDLVESRKLIAAVDPETVYLLARPVSQEAGVLLDFTQNIQWLLQEWADRRCLKRVVFASTQLVYATPPDSTPISITSPLGPETPYDCHKAEMEFYLALLAHHPAGINVDVFRLPLLAGRAPTAEQTQQQYLFEWRAAYQKGFRWIFPEDDPRAKEYGNSWVHVDDVVHQMTSPPPSERRFRVLQPASGHLSYFALDAFFRQRYSLPEMQGTLHLAKTTFYLADNAGTRPRPVDDAFVEEVEA